MGKSHIVVSILAPLPFFILLFYARIASAFITQDGSKAWGYVEVRPSELNFSEISIEFGCFKAAILWNCSFEPCFLLVYVVFRGSYVLVVL